MKILKIDRAKTDSGSLCFPDSNKCCPIGWWWKKIKKKKINLMEADPIYDEIERLMGHSFWEAHDNYYRTDKKMCEEFTVKEFGKIGVQVEYYGKYA